MHITFLAHYDEAWTAKIQNTLPQYLPLQQQISNTAYASRWKTKLSEDNHILIK